MAVRSSSRLQKLRQQQIEQGTLLPEEQDWHLLSKELKPRKWHKVPVKLGHFTVMQWQPVNQQEATIGLGRSLSSAERGGLGGSRNRGRAKGRLGFRGRPKGSKGMAVRPHSTYGLKRVAEQAEDPVYSGGGLSSSTNSVKGICETNSQ